MDRIWKPNVTVAALAVRQGRYLLVEEETDAGIRLNQPAGHLDQGESLVAACARETLEETAWHFTPTVLVGIYQWTREQGDRLVAGPPQDEPAINKERSELSSPPSSGRGLGDRLPVTFLRFAFTGELGAHEEGRALDTGILRALWMTPGEIEDSRDRHRSPLVWKCVQDHLTNRRFPLDLIRHYAYD